jgi:hypothetical protein
MTLTINKLFKGHHGVFMEQQLNKAGGSLCVFSAHFIFIPRFGT